MIQLVNNCGCKFAVNERDGDSVRNWLNLHVPNLLIIFCAYYILFIARLIFYGTHNSSFFFLVTISACDKMDVIHAICIGIACVHLRDIDLAI